MLKNDNIICINTWKWLLSIMSNKHFQLNVKFLIYNLLTVNLKAYNLISLCKLMDFVFYKTKIQAFDFRMLF